MASQEQLSCLLDGVNYWNHSRSNSPEDVVPDLDRLSNADFERTPLWDSVHQRANLSEVDFRNAKLQGANLARACLFNADLTGADLRGSHLESTDLRGTKLARANLTGAFLNEALLDGADLSGADLFNADLQKTHAVGSNFIGANLDGAILNGADFRRANLGEAIVASVRYSRSAMRGKFEGALGIGSLRGNPIFLRDAADQVYIDAVDGECRLNRQAFERFKDESNLGWMFRLFMRIIARFLFLLWGGLDYGRSLSRLALISGCLVVGFAGVFEIKHEWFHWPESFGSTQAPVIVETSHPQSSQCDESFAKHESGNGQNLNTCSHTPEVEHGFITALYFSVVTFTTLGYGDVYPLTTEGRIVAMCEVLIGYISLGLLLAVLANTVARRS